MKRMLALILIWVMILTSTTLPVHATEQDDDLLSKACIVFPEHSSKILGTVSPVRATGRSSSSNNTVISETRPVSDREYITYTEYADGQIILTDVRGTNPFSYNKTINSYFSGSGGSTTDITITVQYVGQSSTTGKFMLENIIYSNSSEALSVINSAGTASVTGSFDYDSSKTTIVYNETNSAPAKIRYVLSYVYDTHIPGAVSTGVLLFELKSGNATISVSNTT